MSVLRANIGDILSCTWGHSIQKVDFYKVIKVSPSGKSVTLQRLQADVVEGDMWSGYVMPSVYPHPMFKLLKNKRIKAAYGGGYGVRISEYQYATLWSGEKEFYNRMD